MPLDLPDYEGNLRARTEAWIDCDSGPAELVRKKRAREWNRCKYDIVYWIETYCWLYNPLFIDDGDDGYFPAVLFGYQKELIYFLRQMLEECNSREKPRKENIALQKCRETAGSWSCCFVTVHDFLFWNGMHLWFSRKEEEVDQGGNMDTPFEKMRSILRRLPDWMMPNGWDWRLHSNTRLLKNPQGGSIEGEAMTKDGGAGGRKRVVWFDEFARTQKGADFASWRSCSMTTNLRVAICSPEGPNNKFAYLCKGKEDERCIVIKLDWWKDPRKMQNAEWLRGELTSPWLRQCEEAFDKVTLASQVFMSFELSTAGMVMEGFDPFSHVRTLQPIPGVPIIVGLDPGPWFSAHWVQLLGCRCYRVLRGWVKDNANIDDVGESIININNNFYAGYQIKYCGDPAGSHVNSASQKGKSDFVYLQQGFGMNINYSFMYKIQREDWLRGRIQAGVTKMGQYCDKCKAPKFLVDAANCKTFKEGCEGEYRYIVGPDGKSTGIVDEEHPTEDAMDSGLYPLLFTGQFIPGQSQERRISVPKTSIPWGKPSQMYHRR